MPNIMKLETTIYTFHTLRKEVALQIGTNGKEWKPHSHGIERRDRKVIKVMNSACLQLNPQYVMH